MKGLFNKTGRSRPTFWKWVVNFPSFKGHPNVKLNKPGAPLNKKSLVYNSFEKAHWAMVYKNIEFW